MLTENINVVWWGFHLQTTVSAVVHGFGDPASKGAHMAWPVGAPRTALSPNFAQAGHHRLTAILQEK